MNVNKNCKVIISTLTTRCDSKKPGFADDKVNDMLKHGIIIRTGITCKKIRCYMRDSACRWLIVENAKIFRSYVKHF